MKVNVNKFAAIAAMIAGFVLVAAQPVDDGRTIEAVEDEIARIEAELAALPSLDDLGHFETVKPHCWQESPTLDAKSGDIFLPKCGRSAE